MIVITGATGHIGNVLVRKLLARGEKVRAIVPDFEDALPLQGLNVEKYTADLRQPESLIKAFDGAEVVYHLAGAISILPGKKKFLEEVNLQGTRNVIDACIKTGVKRLIYTSSIHAIREPPQGTVIDESCPFDPEEVVGDYAKSKAKATLEVCKAVEKGLDAVIVCPTGVVGPYDFRHSEIGQMIIDFMQKRLKAYIDGAYDFVDVRDVAFGHILACERGKSGEAYILSGERITISQLLNMLEEITGVKAPRLKIPIWLARFVALFTTLHYLRTGAKPRLTSYSIYTLQSNSFISSEKAKKELGYSPRPLRQSIEDTVKWFMERKEI